MVPIDVRTNIHSTRDSPSQRRSLNSKNRTETVNTSSTSRDPEETLQVVEAQISIRDTSLFPEHQPKPMLLQELRPERIKQPPNRLLLLHLCFPKKTEPDKTPTHSKPPKQSILNQPQTCLSITIASNRSQLAWVWPVVPVADVVLPPLGTEASLPQYELITSGKRELFRLHKKCENYLRSV